MNVNTLDFFLDPTNDGLEKELPSLFWHSWCPWGGFYTPPTSLHEVDSAKHLFFLHGLLIQLHVLHANVVIDGFEQHPLDEVFQQDVSSRDNWFLQTISQYWHARYWFYMILSDSYLARIAIRRILPACHHIPPTNALAWSIWQGGTHTPPADPGFAAPCPLYPPLCSFYHSSAVTSTSPHHHPPSAQFPANACLKRGSKWTHDPRMGSCQYNALRLVQKWNHRVCFYCRLTPSYSKSYEYRIGVCHGEEILRRLQSQSPNHSLHFSLAKASGNLDRVFPRRPSAWLPYAVPASTRLDP